LSKPNQALQGEAMPLSGRHEFLQDVQQQKYVLEVFTADT